MKKDFSEGRIPPQDIAAEEAVIGAILLDTRAWNMAQTVIRGNADIFYKEAHSIIYSAFKDLVDKKSAIDLLTVADHLDKQSNLAVVGGALALSKLSQKVSSSAHTVHHAEIIKEKYLKRELIRLGTEAVMSGYDNETSPSDVAISVSANIGEITRVMSNDSVEEKPMGIQIVDRISKIVSGEYTGVTWGHAKLDDKLGGQWGGDNCYIAARPAMGKTAVLIQKALASAMQNMRLGNGKRVRVYSLEMTKIQLYMRAVCTTGKFTMDQLFKPQQNKAYIEKRMDDLLTVVESLEALPLDIIDKPMTFQEMMLDLSIAHTQNPISDVLFDYLQLIRHGGKFQSREQEVGTIAKEQKLYCKELNVPFTTLSQLSRGVESRNNKRPVLADMRDSGQIEEAADSVAFLYRPSYYDPDDIGPDEFIVAKHRNGDVGTVDMLFNKNHQIWDDYDAHKPSHYMDNVRDPSAPDTSSDDSPF